MGEIYISLGHPEFITRRKAYTSKTMGSAHVYVPKEYAGRDVYIIIPKEGEDRIFIQGYKGKIDNLEEKPSSSIFPLAKGGDSHDEE